MYGVGKVAAEVCAQSLQRFSGFDIRIARISNPFGPSNLNGKPQGVASIFTRRILKGEEIVLLGDGSVVRDYLHVDDVVTALLALMEADIGSDTDNIFNIGSGVGLSINEVIDIIIQETGAKPNILRRPSRDYDVKASILDISKAHDVLGWKPCYVGEEGIAHLVEEVNLSGFAEDSKL